MVSSRWSGKLDSTQVGRRWGKMGEASGLYISDPISSSQMGVGGAPRIHTLQVLFPLAQTRPPSPLPALGRACRVRGAAIHRARTNCWGGWRRWRGGVGNAIPRERGKGSKIQIKRYMYPRNEPFLSLGAWGRTHRGGVLETEEWGDSIRRRATGLGQGAMAQEPSLRWCVLTGTNVSAPLSSVCGPGSFPPGDFLNADWESRAAQCRRALERGQRGRRRRLRLRSVSATPHCQLVWSMSEMESSGFLFFCSSPEVGRPQCESPILPGRMKRGEEKGGHGRGHVEGGVGESWDENGGPGETDLGVGPTILDCRQAAR